MNLKRIAVVAFAAIAALSLCACNEYKEAQDSFYGEMGGLMSEANDLKDSINENIYGTSDYLQSSTTAPGDAVLDAKDAADISAACKELYSGIISGDINDDMTNTGGMNLSRTLPSAGETAAERKKSAGLFTVSDAISFSGKSISVDNMFYVTSAFGAYENGDIIAGSDPVAEGRSSSLTRLTPQTTLGELYGI